MAEVAIIKGEGVDDVELSPKEVVPVVHHGILDVLLLDGERSRIINDQTPNEQLLTEQHGSSGPFAVLIDIADREIHTSKDANSAPAPPGFERFIWNENFKFQIHSDVTKLQIALFLHRFITVPWGIAVVPLDKVFHTGHVPALKYKVHGLTSGEIAVALTFSPNA